MHVRYIDAYVYATAGNDEDASDPLVGGTPSTSGASTAQINYAYSAGVAAQLNVATINTLGIPLDPASLAYFQDYIAFGYTVKQITLELAESNLCVNRLDNNSLAVLGRDVTSTDLVNDWLAIINNGASVTSIRTAEAYSTECANQIAAIFSRELGRADSSTDLAGWQVNLTNGLSLLDLDHAAAYSAEASNDIYGIFERELARADSASDLAAWQNNLQVGYGLNTLESSAAYSPEAASKIYDIFERELARADSASDLAAWQNNLQVGYGLNTLESSAAYSPEAASKIYGIFERELGRADSASDLAAWQNNLFVGYGLSTLESSAAYSPEAANDIYGIFERELGRADNASDLAAWQNNLVVGYGLSTLESQAAYSPEAAAKIFGIFEGELGRADSASDLAAWQNNLFIGYGLTTLESSAAYSAEASSDISSAFQGIDGSLVDANSLATMEQNLNGQSIAGVIPTLLNLPAIQADLSEDWYQILLTDPTPAQLSAETSVIASSVTAMPGLTWNSLISAVGNGVMTFLSEVNPISSAEAASAGTSPAQQATNLAAAKAVLANPNTVAFLHAIAAAENSGYGGYNASAYSRIYGGGTAPNLAAFPTNTPSGHSPAGAYQVTRTSYAFYGGQIGIKDFSQASQDLVGAWDFIHTGGYAALLSGNFAQAEVDAANEWAAVPIGSGSLDYSRHGTTNVTNAQFVATYHSLGGK